MSHHRSLRHRRPLPPRAHFARHLLRNGAVGVAFVFFSLTLGAIGYHGLAGIGWLDAYLNAAMILTGMGPLAPLASPSAKLFGILYTLYSALAFLTTAAVLLGPAVARLIHRLHLEMYGDVETSPE
ncbi:MAG: hypothetical protein FIA95_12650 [Gemmatimonadetes bacterium]|nr:hypothetical protein [Gemmatimonadota bacterium]